MSAEWVEGSGSSDGWVTFHHAQAGVIAVRSTECGELSGSSGGWVTFHHVQTGIVTVWFNDCWEHSVSSEVRVTFHFVQTAVVAGWFNKWGEHSKSSGAVSFTITSKQFTPASLSSFTSLIEMPYLVAEGWSCLSYQYSSVLINLSFNPFFYYDCSWLRAALSIEHRLWWLSD